MDIRERITVVASFKREVEGFISLLEGVRPDRVKKASCFRGSLHGREVLVAVTGSGRAQEDESLLKGSRLVVSAGICGGLLPYLGCGDIVIAERVFFLPEEARSIVISGMDIPVLQYRDIPESRIAFDILTRELGPLALTVKRGPTVTTEQPLIGAGEKRRVGERTGATSVDMEDYYRLEAAERLGVPLISIRAVYDLASDDEVSRGDRLDAKRLSIAAESLAAALGAVVRAAGNFA
jgi:nucleoside phosphorylase